MIRTIIIICLSTILYGCANKSDQKTTKMLIASLENIFEGNYSDADIDNLGNFTFDMGSATGGRVSGKINDVFISMEILPERPGCADICPEQAVIHFKCNDNNNCITNPANPKLYGYYNEGTLTFEDLEKGQEIYRLLNQIQIRMKTD